MNDAEKEAIRCLGFSLTKVCPRHSEDEECALCDGTGKIYTCEGLGVISKFTQTLQKKQDEIERLKNLTHFGYSEVPELKKEIERLTKKLSEAEAELNRLNHSTYCVYCGFEVALDADSSVISEHIRTCEKHPIRDYEKQIQALTARNKELEQENQHLANVSVSLNSKIEDFKKSEKALQGRTVSCEACNGMAEKVKDLESKLAAAREAMSECLNSGRIEYWWAETLQKALAELGEK